MRTSALLTCLLATGAVGAAVALPFLDSMTPALARGAAALPGGLRRPQRVWDERNPWDRAHRRDRARHTRVSGSEGASVAEHRDSLFGDAGLCDEGLNAETARGSFCTARAPPGKSWAGNDEPDERMS